MQPMSEQQEQNKLSVEQMMGNEWISKQTPEYLFAKALLKVEPEKIIGGSPARQKWLTLVLQTEVFILENNLSIELFKREMGLLDYHETLMMDALQNV